MILLAIASRIHTIMKISHEIDLSCCRYKAWNSQDLLHVIARYNNLVDNNSHLIEILLLWQ
jgi:hypothetical protein